MFRKILAYVLHYLGDFVCTTFLFNDSWFCKWFFDGGFMYPVYNKLMIWSSDIQGNGDGPWSSEPDEWQK